MHRRTISVVIPARNEAARLGATLGAVSAQTRCADELIVVDNASTDRTAEIAREFGAKTLYCPTLGVARARQMGLEAAAGDWIATTDADSLPDPNWLAAFESRMAGAVALYGPLAFSETSRVNQALSGAAYRTFLWLASTVGAPNLAGANMAFERRAALSVGGYPLVEAAEDVQLGKKLRAIGSIRYVSEALVLTSPRRLRRGRWAFLRAQLRNLAGRPEGYFDDASPG